MPVEPPSVIIIGGGISGLTAAYKLQQAGYSVTILERSERVGGAMYTHLEDGWLAEFGPNTILETNSKIKSLVTELGLDEEKVYSNSVSSNRFIVKNAKLLSLPKSLLSFLSSSLFNWKSKLKILREPFVPKWQNQYEESLSEFVLRRLGKNFLDYAVNPFVSGVYAGDPEKLSVKHALPKLYQLEQDYGSLIKGQVKKAKLAANEDEIPKNKARMFSFKGGMKVLPETIASNLKNSIEFDAKVEQVQKMNGEWEIKFVQNDESKTLKAENLIYAGTGHQLANCKIINTEEIDLSFGSEIEYPPVSVLTLGYHQDQIQHALNGFGVLIPQVENLQILGALFMGGARQPEFALMSEDKRLEIAVKNLGILLGISGSPAFVFHKQWTKAIPQFNMGYGKIKSKFQHLEKDNIGLYFTGNYRDGISVADTILHAMKTAELIKSTNNIN